MSSIALVRRGLLTTGSAVALALGAVQAAEAQPSFASATPQTWFTVGGQYTMLDGDAINLDDEIRNGPDDGFALTGKAGGKFYGEWWGALGVNYGRALKNRELTYYGFPGGLTTEYDENRILLDLEIGRDVGLGSLGSVRAFGGLRFAHFDGEVVASAIYYDTNIAELEHRFTGAGPRFGLQADVPLADALKLEVSAVGAVLIGKQNSDLTVYNGYNESNSDTRVAPNIEASIALNYAVAPNVSVGAGYRVQQFWNILGKFVDDGFKAESRLIHGPFLDLTIRDW